VAPWAPSSTPRYQVRTRYFLSCSQRAGREGDRGRKPQCYPVMRVGVKRSGRRTGVSLIRYKNSSCVNQPTASSASSGEIVCPPSNSR
jgi:hypothetical protein